MTDYGQLQMTLDNTYFDTTGKGIGEMFGFAICNGQNGTNDLGKKFLIGYASQSSATPTTLPTTGQEEITNYKKLGNIGGMETVQLTDEHMTPHNHFDYTIFLNNVLVKMKKKKFKALSIY